MNVNQKIERAIGTIVKQNVLPMKCPKDSPPDLYAVYNPELEEPGYYADDAEEEWTQHMQVHIFTKTNYIELRRRIRKSLRENDFTLTGIQTFYEKDTGYYHLCFECYTEEEEWLT